MTLSHKLRRLKPRSNPKTTCSLIDRASQIRTNTLINDLSNGRHPLFFSKVAMQSLIYITHGVSLCPIGNSVTGSHLFLSY